MSRSNLKSIPDLEQLKKLTVPQLKILCKENNLSGYSKLAKGLIIQKLVDHSHNSFVGNVSANVPLALPTTLESTPVINTQSGLQPTSETILAKSNNASATHLSNEHNLCEDEQQSPTDDLSDGVQAHPSCCSSISSVSALKQHPSKPSENDLQCIPELIKLNATTSKKRSFVLQPVTSQVPPKKSKPTPKPGILAPVVSSTPSTLPVLFKVPIVPSKAKPISSSIASVVPVMTFNQIVSPRNPFMDAEKSKSKHVTSGRRFNPLITKTQTRSLGYTPRNPPSLVLATQSLGRATLTTRFTWEYLDFSALPVIPLFSISLPPSVSERRRVPRLALLLSEISAETLKQCCQVSRLFRYAAYISASYRLSRDFEGRRLSSVVEQYPQTMTNMWPYLLQRNQEILQRRRIFDNSFLGRTLKDTIFLSEHLWSSPDNEKQITIAVRFLLTRLFFQVSVGGRRSGQHWSAGTIIDAQELVKGEIWSITIRFPAFVQVLFVLEHTCEVIGLPPSPLKPTSSSPDYQTSKHIHLRADWSSYITNHLSVQGPPTLRLQDYLNWTNHEEYSRGISKLWLKRIASEGIMGAAKKVVAERYILACVVGNSVSGRWMSSTEMAQDFNGLSSNTTSSTLRTPRLHLFLPAHHHIESLHFTSSNGQLLHPALAVVQTPCREYYILKDNGMQVGCEEEGVASVWMQLLGCSSCGT